MSKAKLNPEAVWKNTQRIVSGVAAGTVVDLPRELDNIRKHGVWKTRRRGDGKRYECFAEAMVDQQPHGLGLGQYHGWIRPFQVHEICDGFLELQKEIRMAATLAARPVAENGAVGKGRRKNSCDNVTAKGRGNSAEYRLSRMVRDSKPDSRVSDERRRAVTEALRKYCNGETSINQAFREAYHKGDSDANRNEIDRIRMYWNRATVAQRKQIAKMIETAGTRKIS
jgi:hypothetical protein